MQKILFRQKLKFHINLECEVRIKIPSIVLLDIQVGPRVIIDGTCVRELLDPDLTNHHHHSQVHTVR